MATVKHMTEPERYSDMFGGTPRQRVSKSTALVLTDTWQTIQFVSGNSTYDVNTFPEPRWDFVNHKMIANPNTTMEQAYDLSFDYQVTNVKGASKVQLRFVIPAPTPIYVPFPDDGTTGYVDLAEINNQGVFKKHFQFPIYASTNIRTYGLQIQIRAVSYVTSSNILTGILTGLLTILTGSDRVTLNNCSLNIYSK